MYGYIYKTTNSINQKIYIGQHKAQKFNPKYLGSGKLLWRAETEYGKENFIAELLEEIDNAELMDEREQYWIAFYNSTDKTIGYNILKGGQKRFFTGQKHTAAGKKKMSQKALERSKRINHDAYRTNQGRICVFKNNENKMIYKEDLDKYLADGWTKGKYFSVRPTSWSKGLSKYTNQYLAESSDKRKKAFLQNTSIGCFGRKADQNTNWKSDEYLIENYIQKGFADYWQENGKIKTWSHFHIGPKIFDRCLALAGLEETPEHRKYIYNKNKCK